MLNPEKFPDIPIGLFDRLKSDNVGLAANDSLGEHLTPQEVDQIEANVAARFEDVLDALLIERDHNTQDTAKRVARMYVREVFAGRYEQQPPITDFPNAKKLDELYTVGPIAIRSACSHHFCPVEGSAWCGVVPGERIIGLSKFSRLARWILARPQIQEEAVVQLADRLEQLIKPRGLAVVLKLRHSCMTWRGVREQDTVMQTNVVRGILKHDARARSEFFASIG